MSKAKWTSEDEAKQALLLALKDSFYETKGDVTKHWRELRKELSEESNHGIRYEYRRRDVQRAIELLRLGKRTVQVLTTMLVELTLTELITPVPDDGEPDTDPVFNWIYGADDLITQYEAWPYLDQAAAYEFMRKQKRPRLRR